MPDNNPKQVNIAKSNTPLLFEAKDHPYLKGSDISQTSKPYFAEIGDTDFGQSKYDKTSPTSLETIRSGDYQYNRGEQQSGLAQLGLGVLRVGAKALVETAKTPGYLSALGEATFTDKTLAESLDNAYLNGLEGLERTYKEAIPVYKSYKSGKGGLMDNIASTSFWASEGADGLGYMIGMFAPGAALKGINLAVKAEKLLLKVGVKNALKASSLGEKVELGTQTLLNTFVESGAESKGVADRGRSVFKDILNPESPNYNPINPATGKDWTKEEVDASIADGTRSTFLLNAFVLFGPNLIMNKNLLGRFNKDKSVLDKFKDINGNLMANPIIKKQFIKDYAKKVGIGIALEGFWEEGSQSSIENYEIKRLTGQTTDGLIKGLINEYGNTLTTLEGQKSILLGSVLGGLGGVAGQYRQNKQFNQIKPTISKLISNNFKGFSDDLDIFERDDNNVIKNDENGQPVINKEKALNYFYNLASESEEAQVKDLAAFDNNKLMYDYFSNKQFVRYSLPFIQQGALGLEILDDHIDKSSNSQLMTDQKELSETQGVSYDENKYKQQLKSKARELQVSYNQTLDVLKDLPFLQDFVKSNPKEGNKYINDLGNSVFQENAKQIFYKEKIQDLNKELMELNSSLSADLPQNQTIATKINKDIDDLTRLLEKSKEDYKAIFSAEEQLAAFEQYKQDSKTEENIANSQPVEEVETPEVKTKKEAKTEEVDKELQSKIEQLTTIDNFNDLNLLRNEIKNHPLHTKEMLNQINEKEKQLKSIVNTFAENIINNTLENNDNNQQFLKNNLEDIEKRIQELKAIKDTKKPVFDDILKQSGIEPGSEVEQDEQTEEEVNAQQKLVSEANSQGLFSDNESTQTQIDSEKSTSNIEKGINVKNNVVMVHIFDHYFENEVFKFDRNEEGFPKDDNVSKIDISALNGLKIGDKLDFELVKVSSEVEKIYRSLKDYDGKHIAIKHNGRLVGFVQQPHPVSPKSLNPALSEAIREELIEYRKQVVSLINQGISVTEKVEDKGTGNLYTKINVTNSKKLIAADFNVFETARPQDKVNGSLVFVYADETGKLVLPKSSNQDFSPSDITSINKRLNELAGFKLKSGRVYQLVKDLTDKWYPMPVYANKINSKTLDNIEEVLSFANNSSETKDIIRDLQPYIYASSSRIGAMMAIIKENNKINVWANGKRISLDDFNNVDVLRKEFLKNMLGLPQNIDVININNPSVQEKMADRENLFTNVTTFEGEYFVQPYIEYSQNSMLRKETPITDNQVNNLSAAQPSSKPSTSVSEINNIANRKRKDLFPDENAFAQVVGDSEIDLKNEIKKARLIEKNENKAKQLEAELKKRESKISSYKEVNGIGIAEYTNPVNNVIDIIMSGTSDNDYVGYVRIYQNGKPTNRWTSKMENKSQNKTNIKTMLAEVQKLLPQNHEYTEKTNISLDGLKTYAQQLKYGYKILLDNNGNPVVNQVILNKASITALQNAKSQEEINDLYNEYKNLTRVEYNEIKVKINALMPQARVLPFNETNGTISIDLPVLKSEKLTQPTTDTKAEIQKRIQEELNNYNNLQQVLENKYPIFFRKGLTKQQLQSEANGVLDLNVIKNEDLDLVRVAANPNLLQQRLDKINAKAEYDLADLGTDTKANLERRKKDDSDIKRSPEKMASDSEWYKQTNKEVWKYTKPDGTSQGVEFNNIYDSKYDNFDFNTIYTDGQKITDEDKIKVVKKLKDEEYNEKLNTLENSKTTTDFKSNIDNDIQDVLNAKNKEELIKASEKLVGMNPYDAGAVSMGIRSALMTPGSFDKGKSLFLEEIKNAIKQRRKSEETKPSKPTAEDIKKQSFQDKLNKANNAIIKEKGASKTIDNTILNRNLFEKWLKKNLPQLNLSDVNNVFALKDTIIDAFGLFKDSTIFLFEGAGMKTAYHEAFHGVFRNLLTVKQREEIISEAKTKYPAPTLEDLNSLQKDLKNQYTEQQLTYLYYEEKIADSFATFVNDKNSRSLLGKLSDAIVNFFNKIIQYFNLFKSKETSALNSLFDNINNGKLATIKSNSNSVVNIPIFSEYAYSKKLNKQLGVSNKARTVEAIGNSFMAKYQEALLSGNKTIPLSVFQSILDVYSEKLMSLDENSDDFGLCGKIILNFPELISEVKKYLSIRNVKIKDEIQYKKTPGKLTTLNNNSGIEIINPLNVDEVEDNEIYTLESKAVKGFTDWTSISGLSSSSARMRLFLSSIPVLDYSKRVPVNVFDEFGIQKYWDFHELYVHIEDNLIDLYEFEEKIDKLKELTKNRPELKQVIDKLTNRPSSYTQDQFDLLQNDFDTNFNKQNLLYTLFKFDTDSSTGQTTHEIIESNRTSLARQLSDSWKSNVFDVNKKNIIGFYDKGEGKIDVKKAKKLLEEWNGLPEKPKAKFVNTKLLKAGIEYSNDTLLKLVEENDPEWRNDVSIVLQYYASGLDLSQQKTFREAMFRLIAKEVDNSKNKNSSSFIDGRNKNIFAVQLPTFISKTIAKIKNRDKFAVWMSKLQQDPFYKNSNILSLLKNKSDFKENFKVSYIDSSKDSRGTREGVSFTKMTPKDYAITQIVAFRNLAVNSQKETSLPINKCFYLTPADKSMQVIIDSTSTQVMVDSKGELLIQSSPIIYNGQGNMHYYNVFLQEANRIKTNIDIKNDIISNKGKGKYKLNMLLENYHMSKGNFEELSKLVVKDELTEDDVNNLSKMFDGFAYKFNCFSNSFNKTLGKDLIEIIENSTKDNLESNLESIKKQVVNGIAKDIQDDFNTTLKEMISKGVIQKDNKTGLYSSKTIELVKKIDKFSNQEIERTPQDVNDDILNILVDFSANTKLNNIEFSNIFNGDIAKYKANNLAKRAPQAQTMTILGKFINKVIKTRVVKDVISKLDKKEYDEIFDSLKDSGFSDSEIKSIINPYLKTNVTDGEVYISPELYKRIHDSMGTWSSEMQLAYDIAEGSSISEIPENLRRKLLGIKPFYFGDNFNEDLGIMDFQQIKCSMIPLFKAYTDLNPLLADIRKDMLKKDKNGNTTLDMVAHESAFKAALGFRNDIFDSTGSVTLNLSTDNFGLQTSNVDHIESGNDSTRQLKMLILGTIDKNKTYRGTNGKDLIDLITKLEATNIKESLKEVLVKLNVKDNVEFSKFIEASISKRKENINVEEGLLLENGDFKYALDSGNLSTQVENLISSVFTDNAVKQEFEIGGDAVQATSLGFKFKSEFKNLLEQQKNLTKEALIEQGKLKWIKPNKENGYIEFAECAMPAWTKKFFNEKGFLIDAENIPEELRELIVYRIPNEGLHTMLPIRVVKFLPETMGNFILLPYQITTQFGSDFDFDKIFFIGKEFYKTINEDKEEYFRPYTYYPNQNETGLRYNDYLQYTSLNKLDQMDFNYFAKLSIEEQNVRPARNNEIINSYFKVLTDIKNLNLLIKPSSFEALTKFKQDNFSKEIEEDFFSSNTQRELKDKNHVSIDLKGQVSLHVTGHSYGSLMNLSTASYIRLGKNDYKLVLDKTVNIDGEKRTNFSGLYNEDNKLISDEIASVLAGVLDDVSNPILKSLGIDNNTVDIFVSILRSGKRLEDALTFISQPIIKQLSANLTTNTDKIKEFNQGQFSVDDLIDSCKAKAKEALNKVPNNSGENINWFFEKIEDNEFYIKTKDIKKYINNFNEDNFIKAGDQIEILKYWSNQARVLKQFKNIEIISKELVKTNKIFAINKEVGPNIEDIISKKEILSDLLNSKVLNGFDITKIPTLRETWNVHLSALKWFGDYFPYGSKTYMNIKQLLAFEQGSKNISEYAVKDRIFMNSFIRTYSDYNSFLFKDVDKEYVKLLRELPAQINDIFKFHEEEKFLGTTSYSVLRNNVFLKEIKEYQDKDNSNYYLQLRGNRLNLQVKNNVISGLTALYSSEDPMVREFAIDLIKHSFLTTGFFKGVNSYASLISPEILDDLKIEGFFPGKIEPELQSYNEFRKNAIYNLNSEVLPNLPNSKRIVKQMIRNNPRAFSKVFDSKMFTEDATNGLPKTITTNKLKIKDAKRLKDMLWEDSEGIERSPLIISVFDEYIKKVKLYERNDNNVINSETKDDFSTITYDDITPLGKIGNLIEIYINEENPVSKLQNNNSDEDSNDDSQSEILGDDINIELNNGQNESDETIMSTELPNQPSTSVKSINSKKVFENLISTVPGSKANINEILNTAFTNDKGFNVLPEVGIMIKPDALTSDQINYFLQLIKNSENDAFYANVGKDANVMLVPEGKMWDQKQHYTVSGIYADKSPVESKNTKVENNSAYSYYETDKEGNLLKPVSKETLDILSSLFGDNLNNIIDATIGNVYFRNTGIGLHKDTTEPNNNVGVYGVVLGNSYDLQITTQETNNPKYGAGAGTEINLEMKQGTVYKFGLNDDKGNITGRFITHRPVGNANTEIKSSGVKLPELNLPEVKKARYKQTSTVIPATTRDQYGLSITYRSVIEKNNIPQGQIKSDYTKQEAVQPTQTSTTPSQVEQIKQPSTNVEKQERMRKEISNIIIDKSKGYSFNLQELNEVKRIFEKVNPFNTDPLDSETIEDGRDFKDNNLKEYGMSDQQYSWAKNNESILSKLNEILFTDEYPEQSFEELVSVLIDENTKLIDTFQTNLFDKTSSIPSERQIKVEQFNITIKPDGKMFYENGNEVTDQTTKNKVNIRKELQDKTLKSSVYNGANYFVLSDDRIVGSGKTNLGKESITDNTIKEKILAKAVTYKKLC